MIILPASPVARGALASRNSTGNHKEENLGATAVQLTSDDLQWIEAAASGLHLEGARLPEYALKMTGL